MIRFYVLLFFREKQKREGTYMTEAEKRKRDADKLKLKQMIDNMIATGISKLLSYNDILTFPF